MEGAHGVEKGPKKMGHPHHTGPKPETGYTDEAAQECHDLIDRAEEDAHLHDPNSMYSTTDKPEPVHRMKGAGVGAGGGLEGAQQEGTRGGAGAAQKAQETGAGASHKLHEAGQHTKSTLGEKMGQMKEKMGMHK